MTTRFGNRTAGVTSPAASQKGRFAGVNPAGSRFPQMPFDFSGTIELIETRRAITKGDTFIADLKVLESDVDFVRPGEQFAWVQAMTDKWNTGAGKVMNFVIALGNLDDDEVAELIREAEQGVSILDAACGVAVEKYGENPLKGSSCRVRVTKGAEDNSGGNWRDCAFSPVE